MISRLTLFVVQFLFLCIVNASSAAPDIHREAFDATNNTVTANIDNAAKHTESPLPEDYKIVSLAPHLTEWVYSLGLDKHLVAVSDYSDFPKEAILLPRVADYQGADIASIVALQPNLVLAWDGGNKPQDMNKLVALGLNVFKSKITIIDDIPTEITRLANLTHTQSKAKELTAHFSTTLDERRIRYKSTAPTSVFYYSWTAPLMSIGSDAWANQLLKVCGAQTTFIDSPVDYPQVSVKDVLIRQPKVLVAASKSSKDELEIFWQPHREHLSAPLIVVNPDVTSRFSLRIINELKVLCKGINENA